MKRYGLIGKKLGHSFSKRYFNDKFRKEQLPAVYENLEFDDIFRLEKFLREEGKRWNGFNVTIPYKILIIPLLDDLTPVARSTAAVNTVIIRDGKLTGDNTDVYGFSESMKDVDLKQYGKALILGTGGAARAVFHALREKGIDSLYVSRRSGGKERISYGQIDRGLLAQYRLIVNATPLGMHPGTNACPPLPYEALGREHFLVDLIYNPGKTLFLQKGESQGAGIRNGLEMLYRQAEASWRAWNRT